MTEVRKLISIGGLTAALLVSNTVFGTSDQAKKSSYEPARNAQGHPDIQGIWDFRTLTPLERPEALGNKAVFTAE